MLLISIASVSALGLVTLVPDEEILWVAVPLLIPIVLAQASFVRSFLLAKSEWEELQRG